MKNIVLLLSVFTLLAISCNVSDHEPVFVVTEPVHYRQNYIDCTLFKPKTIIPSQRKEDENKNQVSDNYSVAMYNDSGFTDLWDYYSDSLKLISCQHQKLEFKTLVWNVKSPVVLYSFGNRQQNIRFILGEVYNGYQPESSATEQQTGAIPSIQFSSASEKKKWENGHVTDSTYLVFRDTAKALSFSVIPDSVFEVESGGETFLVFENRLYMAMGTMLSYQNICALNIKSGKVFSIMLPHTGIDHLHDVNADGKLDFPFPEIDYSRHEGIAYRGSLGWISLSAEGWKSSGEKTPALFTSPYISVKLLKKEDEDTAELAASGKE